MAELTYFTVEGDFLAVVGDGSADVDLDPDSVAVTGKVVFTPMVAAGDGVKLSTITPRPAIAVLAPITAAIDNGQLKYRGNVGVRLVADTDVLELDGPLFYRVEFPAGITYNGVQTAFTAFNFQAAQSDLTINLVEVARVPGQSAAGIVNTPAPDHIRRVGDDAVFSANGIDIPDPIDLTDLFTEQTAEYTAAITAAVNALIAGAPGALDTLNELAAALGDDANFATTVTNSLAGKADKGYVRKARYFADGNGTDDTAAAQALLAEDAREYVFRSGQTWIIDANPTTGMLEPLSNTRLIIEEGATVKVKTNALDIYYLFNLDGVQNVTVEGMGTLLGDALVHTGSTGQHGHLINITGGSSDVRVRGPLKLTQAWGDGIYIGGGLVAVNNDILIDGVIIDDCRREGISPFWVDGCTIRNARIVDIASSVFNPGGPGSGIDVEPNDGQYVNDLTIENNYISGTAGNGIYVSTLPAGGVAPYTTNVIIRGNNIVGCGVAAGGALTASGPSGFTNGIYVRDVDDPIIENNVVLNSGFVGDTGFVSTGIKSNLCDRPVITGNTVSGSTGAGVLVTGGTQPEIVGNTVRNNGQRGISTGVAGTVIRGNQVFDNNQSAGSGEHHVSISGSGCVVQGNTFRGSNGNSWVRISGGSDSLIANNVGLGTAPTNKYSDGGTTTRKSLNFHIDTGVFEAWDTSGATPVGVIELGHATDTTVARTAAGRAAIEGAEIITSTEVAAVSAKATPVDADLLPLFDSAASNAPKSLSWANLKAAVKAYYDAVTSTLTNKSVDLASNTLTGTTAQFNTALSDGDFATLAGSEALTNKTLTAPTIGGASIVPQSGTVALHNQADQTTNYERARHFWSSDIYNIATEQAGSGTARTVNIVAGAAGSVATFGSTQGPTIGTVRLRCSLSAASGTIAGVNGTLSASSGTQYGLSVSPTITQTSTAGVTVLLVNLTETTTGSGTRLLADFQVGGTSKAKIDDTGVVSAVASGAAGTVPVYAAVPATASSTGTAGQMARDASFVYFCTATNTWVRAALATW